MIMAETPASAAPRGRRNEKTGTVVSNKMAKTITVEVVLRASHPLYRRGITKRRKFYAHDERQECQIGDVVRIAETRPLSRLKRWRLVEIVRRAALLPSRAEVVAAVGEEELNRDTRRRAARPAGAEPAGGEAGAAEERI
ncbi:MAG: 30S ribosomal protein S17 [Terriglobales bacterium]